MVAYVVKTSAGNDTFFGEPHSSGFFQQAGNPDQNHCTHKRHDDGTDHAAAGPDSPHAEDPAAQKAAEDAENDVYNYTVATTLHDLASKPTSYEANDNPCNESHFETFLTFSFNRSQTIYACPPSIPKVC